MARSKDTQDARWTRIVLLPALVALAVVSVQAFRKPLRAPFLDEFYYLTIARDLALHGTFTDSTFKGGPFNRQAKPELPGDEGAEWSKSGRFFAPAYPILAYLVGRADPKVAAAIGCHVRTFKLPTQAQCPNTFNSLVALNVLLWTVGLVALFLIAYRVGRSEAVAWLALIIALATGEPGYYARTYLSETATVPAFLLFMLFSVRSVETGRLAHYGLAGAALGMASLCRPAYAYLFYLVAPLLLGLAVLARSRWPRLPSPSAAALFALAAIVVMAPWMVRNVIQFGDPTLSKGYAEVILMQRVSYNRMSMAEWGVAWIYWLPDFGDDVARRLFPLHLYDLLGWSNPNNYYLDGGGGDFRQRILDATPRDEDVLGVLYRTYLIGDLPKHILVSLPLTMRGLGVAKYLSVAGVVLLWPAMRRLHAEGRLWMFLSALLPPLLMAGLHGFVSVNIERYNLPMIAIYATVVSVWLVALWQRVRGAHD